MFIVNVKINKKIFVKWFIIILIILGGIIFGLTVKKVYLEVNSKGIEKINNSINNSNDFENNSASNLKNDGNLNSNNSITVNSDAVLKFEKNGVIEVETANFTNFLESCNENVNDFEGKTIHISGFVYRLKNFSKNQFVVARLMPIQYKSASASPVFYLSNNQNISNTNFESYFKQNFLKFNLYNTSSTKQFSTPQIEQISDFDENTVVVGILCEGSTLSTFKSNSWVDLTGTISSTNFQEKGQIPLIKVSSIQSIKENLQELFVSIPK